MEAINPSLKFLLTLARIQAGMARRFDSRLGGGLGFNDLVILYHLSQAEDEKLRRVDLAEKVGLTASGITRLLAPMEKIGLVSRQRDDNDARVSYVLLAPGGRRLLAERLEKANLLAEEVVPGTIVGRIEELSGFLAQIGASL